MFTVPKMTPMNIFISLISIFRSKFKLHGIVSTLVLTLCANYVQAANPFEGGWTVIPEESSLTFQTIKNGSKLETSSFANFQGAVNVAGDGQLRIQLDSVDTKVDLRNVRMRFLFFETFKFKEATVSTSVSPAALEGLEASGRITIPLTFVLDLHGLSRAFETTAVVTKLVGGKVSVSSSSPISIAAELFDLAEGVRKLEEAANVSIVPMGSVSFSLVFQTNAVVETPLATIAPAVANLPVQTQPISKPVLVTPIKAAVETVGNLSLEECTGRFEILSRTGGIYFQSGSADLDPVSEALLDTLIDIIERCADLKLVVAGHTDSAGSEDVNQWLSEQRAGSVQRYLSTRVSRMENIRSTGFGELRPVAPNDTSRNRRLNRRIEFLVED